MNSSRKPGPAALGQRSIQHSTNAQTTQRYVHLDRGAFPRVIVLHGQQPNHFPAAHAIADKSTHARWAAPLQAELLCPLQPIRRRCRMRQPSFAIQ